MPEEKPNRLLNSRAYRKARELVKKTIQSPEKLVALVSSAQAKAASSRSGKLAEILDSIGAVFRLLGAYARGDYRDISFESLALVVASIIYFVMPIDVLPDFILGLGLVDDAALLAYTFRVVADDIKAFLDWEAAQQAEPSVITLPAEDFKEAETDAGANSDDPENQDTSNSAH